MFRLIISIVLLISAINCSKIPLKQETSIEKSEISENVRQTLQGARDFIRSGQFLQAVSTLTTLKDETLIPLEKAFKYNLKGVSFFGNDDLEKSLANFEVAAKYAPNQTQIYSQIYLNIASTHYKLGRFDELKYALEKIQKDHLLEPEIKKFAQLNRFYGLKFNKPHLIFISSLDLMGNFKSSSEVLDSPLYDETKKAFLNLKNDEKNMLFENFQGQRNIAAAHFAQLEVESRYSNSDKSGAEDLLDWLGSEFDKNDEVKKFVTDFEFRLENSTKISTEAIGVVLPMSGSKSSFGLKALSSIDASLKLFGLNDKVKVYTKDNQDSPAVGAESVLNLVKEHQVAFIIGGLFPESAKAEYLEAKKYGVLFISLSQVNLPKEEKDHHLIEIQGSIESQVEVLLAPSMIEKFGNRLGVIYPDNDGGKAYLDEIWRQSKGRNVQVTSVASFPRNTHDFRDTSEIFLGLKYPRERHEELKILENVYSFEKTSIRRVQTLPPVLDFDWVFLAAYPQETAQLVPTLGYYDATKLKVIGGPSWGSKSMLKEQKHLGTLFYIGDDPKNLNQDLLVNFSKIYEGSYGLIEVLSLDSMKLGFEVLKLASSVSQRKDLDAKLSELNSIEGLSSTWSLSNGLWLKKMEAMTVSRGEFKRVFE
jgi:hypothetical protein